MRADLSTREKLALKWGPGLCATSAVVTAIAAFVYSGSVVLQSSTLDSLIQDMEIPLYNALMKCGTEAAESGICSELVRGFAVSAPWGLGAVLLIKWASRKIEDLGNLTAQVTEDGLKSYLKYTRRFIQSEEFRLGAELIQDSDLLFNKENEIKQLPLLSRRRLFLSASLIGSLPLMRMALLEEYSEEQAILAKLPTLDAICSVCRESFNLGKQSKTTDAEVQMSDHLGKMVWCTCPGRHLFHENCLRSWFDVKTKKTCPTCRGEPRDPGQPYVSAQELWGRDALSPAFLDQRP